MSGSDADKAGHEQLLLRTFETEDVLEVELFFILGKVLAMQLVLEHHQTPHKLVI